jgi:hypothetical protein
LVAGQHDHRLCAEYQRVDGPADISLPRHYRELVLVPVLLCPFLKLNMGFVNRQLMQIAQNWYRWRSGWDVGWTSSDLPNL